MRERKEIERQRHTIGSHDNEEMFELVLEVLLDIRDYLQRIDLEMPTEPVDVYVSQRVG